MARNIIIFVADGLRPGSINATDTPTLYSVRQNGVNFTNSHSLFPTFTTPNASAIATGHYLGDTGDFSNTVYTGYPVINANGSVTPFIENDPILADINANSNLADPDLGFNRNNFLTEESLLAYARLNGYSTAAIGKLGAVALFDVTQDTRTGGTTTPNITPKTVILDDSTYINTIANATNPPVNGVGSQSAIPLSQAIATSLNNAGLIGQNAPGTTTVATTIGSIRNNQSSGNLTTAGTLNSNAQQQQFFADATTKAVLPQFVTDITNKTSQGFAAVYWSRDPDGTQHNNGDAFNAADPGNNSLTIGISGPTAKKGVQDADANLKQIIDYLKATPDPANPGKTLYDNTDIFVTADHGFSTISRQAVGIKSFDTNGVPTYINTTSYASTLSYYTVDANGVKTPTVHAGFLPAGFVAIDLAKDLGSTLYDPNKPTAPVTTANINNIQYSVVDPTAGQNPLSGNGVIGGNGKVVNGVIDPNTQVVVAANGGSDLLYVPSKDKTLVAKIVSFLAQKDYISGIFTDDAFGDIPGALKLSTIGLKGDAELPTPSIVINFKTFSTNPNNPNDPQAQVEVADTTLQQGQGMHGSFGRGDTFNNMAAIGPDFKSGYVDNAPVSNVDVVPTLTKILGWTIPNPPNATLVGRAATEALVGGPASVPSTSTTLTSTPVNGVSTILKTQTVANTPYFDAAGFAGGTDGLASVTNNFQHVLIISVDGLHNSDLSVANLQSSLTNIKRLQSQGVTFSNAFSAAPSDSFPGELNYITGANPGTTGVFYDKSYSRTLYAPGTKLADVISGKAQPGTGVEFAENVDKTWANNGAASGSTNGTLDGGKGFDTSTLPLRYIPATASQPAQLVPVYPNEYLNVNTIFDVASQDGLTTAWSDKHPAAYTILAGNDQLAVNSSVASKLNPTNYNFATGQVGSITNYSSLEINAAVAIDPSQKGPLPTSAGALVDQSVIPYNASYFDANGKFILPFVNGVYRDSNGNVYYSNAYTKADGSIVTINPNIAPNFFNDGTKGNKTLFAAPPSGTTANQFDSTVTTSTYDDYKVKQILNQIDGLNANGTASQITPAIFGLNIQAVSVAEKDPGTLFNGGGIDANGNARPDLVTAINHTDQSIGLILDELKKQGLDSSTLVVLTAKHGQNPVQDPTVGLSSTFDSMTGAAGGDGNLTAIGALLVRNGIQIASENGGDTSSLIFLKNPTQDLAKAVALLQSTDPNKYSFDNSADKVSDPSGKTLFSTEDFAAQGTVLFGQSLINAGLGDPTKTGTISGDSKALLQADRSPDIAVALNNGYFFGTATKKRSEHGGFTDADTHVALIAGSPSLASNLQGTTNSTTVSTTQIAPTTLEALGLNPNQLQGVQLNKTQDLGATLTQAVPKTVTFKPGNLLVSRSVYAGANLKAGDTLPNGAIAVADGSYPNVFANESVDASFGVTSPIFIDQVTTTGTVIQSLNLTNALKQKGIDISSSFPSKSELGLNLSPDGAAVTFMAYKAAPQSIDVSNSNTPAVTDNTNPVNALGNLTYQRAVVQFDDNFNLQVTPVNAYSGNNGRNAVLGNNGYYYTVGNAGNGGSISLPKAIATTNAGVTTISNSDKSAFVNIVVGQTITGTNIPTASPVTVTSVSTDKTSFTISAAATGVISGVNIVQTGTTLSALSQNTGVQLIKAGDPTGTGNTMVVGVPKGTVGSTTGNQYGFSVTDLGFAADKTGKDDNFRGLTLNPFDNNLYVSKGSGGNGVNTVYKVTSTTTGVLPTEATASTATVTILPGFSTTLASSTTDVIYHPFGLWFANPTTLYVADEGTPLTTTGTKAVPLTNAKNDVNAGLEKWTFDGTKWNLKYTLQNGLNLGQSYSVPNGSNGEVYSPTFNPAVAGLRNITGKVNADGTVSIYGVTSTVSTETDQGADPNTIVAITDNLGFTTADQAKNENFTTIEGPMYGNVYRGVSLAPTVSTPFSGVAAGDATSNDAILWTRTFDSQTKKGVNTNLIAQVSTDSTFATINFTYNVPARTDGLDHDGTAKVDATGLKSGTQYYYRFVTATGSDTSTVGTFKTSPDANTQSAVRFGFSGDADGFMRPYGSTANFGNLNLDFFGFLGDTIYETASNGSPAATTDIVGKPAQALIDYHRKYLENIQPVSNGGFPSLETMFTSQGNYTLLDNHELGNKELINGGATASLVATSALASAGNGSTNTADDVNTTGQFVNQSVGFKTLEQAYSDYQPIKEKTISAPNDPRTNGTQQLYSANQWGQNLLYINTDTRSYRDVRLNKVDPTTGKTVDDTGDRANNPNRTLLGATQLAWLKQTLLDAQKNGTIWKFVAVSDPIDQIGAIGSGADGGKSWIGGYRAERNDLLKFIADNGIKNVVFLATDDHQNRINELTYWDNTSDIGNQSKAKVLQSALSVVDGPIGATGPDIITDHSFTNIKSLADKLAATETAAGVNPIGLDPNFAGLKNVVREGDPNANTLRQPIDFYSPDTFNYTTFDISADGKTLNVNVQGINSSATNSFIEPTTANPVRSILSFSLDATPSTLSIAASTPTATETNTVPGVFTITSDAKANVPLTFNYTVGGTATNGVDYNNLSGTAIIAAGQSSVDIPVKPVDDILAEGNESVTLTLASGTNYTTNVTKSAATVTIIDNEPTPVGTTGDDNLVATPGGKFDGQSNVVFTGAGNDTVDLGFVATSPTAGKNIIDLGSGNDTIYVNKNDNVFGSDGNDTFFAQDSKGGNRISGGAGDDSFWLGANDRALGGDGNDIFRVGLGGGNLIAGGAGADQFWIVNAELPKAANTVLDFQIGTDVIGINGAVSLGISASTLKLNQVGADTAISFNNQTLAVLTGIQASSLSLTNPNQFIFG